MSPLPFPFCGRQVPLLANLSKTAQAIMLESIDYADFQPGELVVREGVSIQEGVVPGVLSCSESAV